MAFRILSHLTNSFFSFKPGPAAFPELSIKASSVLLNNACLPLCQDPAPLSLSPNTWVHLYFWMGPGAGWEGQKASKHLAQELRDPEAFHVALERGLWP